MRKLIYLHGFNSSPQSHKAQCLLRYMRQRGCDSQLLLPRIPPQPDKAIAALAELARQTAEAGEFSVAGSSLGGYYATWLAETWHCPAVLINPSVKPFVTLEAYLGENRFYYEDKTWRFEPRHIDQLREIHQPRLHNPQNYLVLLQTGDETLDYREAEEKYREATCIIEAGGSHAFDGFERYLGRLLDFCRMDCAGQGAGQNTGDDTGGAL